MFSSEDAPMGKPERLVKILLRVSAIVTGSAVLAVFMPRHCMESVHRWLGLGEMPVGPIVDYLARSLSAFYAMLGGLLWLISCDVRRHSGTIVFVAGVGVVFGVAMVVIDILAGMPTYWTVWEGLIVIATNAVLLALIVKARADAAREGGGEMAS